MPAVAQSLLRVWRLRVCSTAVGVGLLRSFDFQIKCKRSAYMYACMHADFVSCACTKSCAQVSLLYSSRCLLQTCRIVCMLHQERSALAGDSLD